MLAALLALLVTLPATVWAVGLVLGWLRKKQILDHPNERSSHSQPTPRGGGLAVTPVVLAVWLGLVAIGAALPGSLMAILGAGLLLALSWLDDRRGGLPARLRLAVHLLACGLALTALPDTVLVFNGALPLWADRAIALLAWVWFVNLTNFMDGIDGITGVQTACVGLGLALLGATTGAAPQALVLAAAAAGFLFWNWHPAKLFLGDSGSVPLGFLTGWLLIDLAGHGHLAAALILPLYYLADASLTLGRRLLRGEKVWQAHRQHFYQQAVRGGASHGQVARLILIADLGLVVLAVLSMAAPLPALVLAALVVAALLVKLRSLGSEALA
jgi:UDP-N-acetylmuramyl pentapeptide phosphotransferase/UDP-N-acetylglucosamine-1-phosphate transferase